MDDLTTRMEAILESFRWLPLVKAINNFDIADVQEAALLQLVSGYQYRRPLPPKIDEYQWRLYMWCRLLGDNFLKLAKERRNNPLPVTTIWLSSVSRFDYPATVTAVCDDIIQDIESIIAMECNL